MKQKKDVGQASFLPSCSLLASSRQRDNAVVLQRQTCSIGNEWQWTVKGIRNRLQITKTELWDMGSCVRNPEVTCGRGGDGRLGNWLFPTKSAVLQAPPLLVMFCPVVTGVLHPPLRLESSKYLGDEVAFKVGVNRRAPWNMWQESDKSLHLMDHCIGKWHVFPVAKGRQAARAKNLLNLCMHLFCRAKEGHEVSFPQW